VKRGRTIECGTRARGGHQEIRSGDRQPSRRGARRAEFVSRSLVRQAGGSGTRARGFARVAASGLLR
jgi:hypothetical protein